VDVMANENIEVEKNFKDYAMTTELLQMKVGDKFAISTPTGIKIFKLIKSFDDKGKETR
jgi:SepF-like predicted cell division protein (DUF552 family)